MDNTNVASEGASPALSLIIYTFNLMKIIK